MRARPPPQPICRRRSAAPSPTWIRRRCRRPGQSPLPTTSSARIRRSASTARALQHRDVAGQRHQAPIRFLGIPAKIVRRPRDRRPPRRSAPTISIAYGMRANEQAITTLVANVAVLAAATYSASDPNAQTSYQALVPKSDRQSRRPAGHAENHRYRGKPRQCADVRAPTRQR